MKIIPAILFILAVSVFTQCSSSSKKDKPAAQPATAPQADNSMNSLDWQGMYSGVLPCADCGGIKTTIYLNKDLSYSIRTKYLGKKAAARNISGRFEWNEKGNTITLDNAATNGFATRYFVGENTLTQLDAAGNKITGDLAAKYILTKKDYPITNKYWKLTELNGKPVVTDSNTVKEPHVIFRNDGQYSGNGGCNVFGGSYEPDDSFKISIGKAMATRMACPELPEEIKFLKALQSADNYFLSGDTLVLNKAKKAPLAKFRRVERN